VVEPGEVRVRVGASSEDIRLEGSFRIEGDVRVLSPREIVATRVEAPAEGYELDARATPVIWNGSYKPNHRPIRRAVRGAGGAR
jgi:hypothetical protein